MNTLKKVITIFTFSYFGISSLSTQIQTDINISIVNQNIWRGEYQAGVSIQPEVNFNYQNWSFQIWGTSDFEREEKELDLSIGYNLKNFNIGLTDYWFSGITDAYSKNHVLENNITYTFTRFPLSLEWHTVLAGYDNSFPVFQRISYSPEWHGYEYEFGIGYSPWRNDLLDSKGFAFNELSVSMKKGMEISHRFTLLCGFSFIYNAYSDNLFFACKMGIPLSF